MNDKCPWHSCRIIHFIVVVFIYIYIHGTFIWFLWWSLKCIYKFYSLGRNQQIISLSLVINHWYDNFTHSHKFFFFFFGLLVFHWTCHSWLCSGKKIFTQYNILYLVFVSFYVSHHSSISKVWNISHTLCTNNIINVNDPTSLKSVPRINANLHWTSSSSFLVKTTATFLLR